jgi:predicted TIM-barrel fold metal-dependent hydrolase
MTVDLIDVHSHHYPEIYLDACKRSDSGFTHYYRDDGRLIVLEDGAVALAAPQPLPSLDHRLDMMDKAGVRIQVLSLSAPNVYSFPTNLRVPLTSDLNDLFVDLAGGAPDRLRVLASVPLPDIDASLAEIDRSLALPRVAGMAVMTTVRRNTLDDEMFTPIWEELSRRKATVFVHPTVACCTEGLRDYALALALDFMAEATNAIARLAYSGTFVRFPGIRWIFTHLGGATPFLMRRFDNYYHQFPECRERIDRPPSEILRLIHFDTCTMHAPALRCALDTFEIDQLVFGSDYPHVPGGIDRFVEILDSVGLAPAERSQIGWANAAKLVGVEAGAEIGQGP